MALIKQADIESLRRNLNIKKTTLVIDVQKIEFKITDIQTLINLLLDNLVATLSHLILLNLLCMF